MNAQSMRLLLAIEQRDKSIPYPPDDREDGTKNIGFRDLKGASEADILAIPEIQDSPALREALIAINSPETPFFTVGCEKSLNPHEGSFWKKGYIEFSYNYAELVKDALPYFVLFFHFNRSPQVLELISTHSIQFFWEIQQGRFKKIELGGFTCCVWITTGEYPTAGECEAVWDEAVRELTQFLFAARIAKLPPSPPIYGPSGQ